MNMVAGPFKTWVEAVRVARGGDDPAILEAVRRASLAAKNRQIAFDRDSVAFNVIEYRWPTLGCIFYAAFHRQMNLEKLHVIDFGGALGSVYHQHRIFFDRIPRIKWSIVEVPNYVKCGRAEFSDDRLQFFEQLPEAAAHAPADVVLMAGSLHLTEAPFDILKQCADLRLPYLILDRTPLTKEREHIIAVFDARPIYNATRPVRLFSKAKLLNELSSIGYEQIADLPEGLFCCLRR